MNIFSQKM